jgi:hypothetical protein
MNRQRTGLRTISHEEQDRVPVGSGASTTTCQPDHRAATFWRNRKDVTIALWKAGATMSSNPEAGLRRTDREADYDLFTVGMVRQGYRVEDPPRKIGDGLWRTAGQRYKFAASNDRSCPNARVRPGWKSASGIRRVIERLADFDRIRFRVVAWIGERFGREKAIVFSKIVIYQP